MSTCTKQQSIAAIVAAVDKLNDRLMNTSERQWFKQSERPVQNCEACEGILVTAKPEGKVLLVYSIPLDLDFYWMPADIPAPPKKELTQAEKDIEKFKELTAPRSDYTYTEAVRVYAAYCRADERARLGKEVEKLLTNRVMLNANELRALFAEPSAKPTQPTNTEAK